MPSYESLRDLIAAEWAVIAQAPINFAATVLVLGIIVWLIARFAYRRHIETLKERIILKDDQLGHLQRQLQADSPSDALVKLGALTAKVEALSIGKWDPLTADQIETLKEKLSAIPPSKLDLEMSDQDARALGASIFKAFEERGWEVEGVRAIGGGMGIHVHPKAGKAESGAAESIAEALRAAGLDVEVSHGYRENLTLSLGNKLFL
jgi:hypothetical protein